MDRKADATKFEFKLEQQPLNTRMTNLIKSAFPMTSSKNLKCFIKIKSLNADKLDTAIENFISSALLYAGENEMFEEFREQIQSLSIQVGHVGDNCIVMFNLNQMDLAQSFAEMIEDVETKLRHLNLQVSASIATAYTLKDVMKYVQNV